MGIEPTIIKGLSQFSSELSGGNSPEIIEVFSVIFQNLSIDAKYL